jgi:hypothetical protein
MDRVATPEINFPYVVTSANPKDFESMQIDVEFILDEIYTKSYVVTNQSGELNLTALFKNVD